ncbi:MAG: hypothetical protein QXT87_06380 [Thermoproteota archaeon]
MPEVPRLLSTSFDRKGVSQAITSVILVMTVMSVSLAAFFFAQLNLTMQSEQTEFENAKEAMVSLAQVIEGLSGKGATAYTSLSLRSGGLVLTPGTEQIIVKVNDKVILNGIVNLVRLRGGRAASLLFRMLKGDTRILSKEELMERDDYLIISPASPGELGLVYVERVGEPYIVMDFGRIRVVPKGTFNYTVDGRNFDKLNLVEVTYFNITYGSFRGSDVYEVYARIVKENTWVEPLLDSTSITITVERGGVSKSYSTNQGGNGTLLFITLVEVEVSVR